MAGENIGKQIVAVSGPTSVVDEKMCDPKIQATHVVTEIKNGFRAFLLFESLATNGTTKEEVGPVLKEDGELSCVESENYELGGEPSVSLSHSSP